MLAILGGIGGGVSRDVLSNDILAVLTNPWHQILCAIATGIAIKNSYKTGQKFREGLFSVHESLLFALVCHSGLPWTFGTSHPPHGRIGLGKQALGNLAGSSAEPSMP
jgi:uncharacterized membrane protein YeiH